MASSSSLHSNMIQFPCLPSVQEAWNVSADEHHYLPARPHTSRDGRRLKQSKSTESLDQRKDRVEFLRRREWTRRVASAGDLQHTTPKRARTYSWEDIIAAADAAALSWDFASSGPAPGRRPATIDELDESDDEPYVIYTATPRPPAPSAYTPAPPPIPGASVLYSTSGSGSSSPYSDSSPSPSPSPSPSHASPAYPVRDLSHAGFGGANPYFARRGLRGPHSRHSSLSSISEEDEGLARF